MFEQHGRRCSIAPTTISFARRSRATRTGRRRCGSAWRRGDIYLGKYTGWYSVRDEAFYGEDEIEERDGKRQLSPKTGTPVEWVEEESYFFKLSAYQDRLLEHL